MSEHAQHKCQIEFQERKFKKRVERKLGKGWVTELRLMDYFLHVCILSHFSHVRFFATPWTVACQAPLSTGFSRQEYWSGKPLPPPGDLPDLGIESRSPALQADNLPSESPGKPWSVLFHWDLHHTPLKTLVPLNFLIFYTILCYFWI